MVTVNLMWVYLWYVFQVQACIREAERIEYLVQTDSPLLKAYTTLTPFLLAPMRAPSTLPASDGQSYPPSLPLLIVLICLTLFTRRTMTLSWQNELFVKRRAFCVKTSQTSAGYWFQSPAVSVNADKLSMREPALVSFGLDDPWPCQIYLWPWEAGPCRGSKVISCNS